MCVCVCARIYVCFQQEVNWGIGCFPVLIGSNVTVFSLRTDIQISFTLLWCTPQKGGEWGEHTHKKSSKLLLCDTNICVIFTENDSYVLNYTSAVYLHPALSSTSHQIESICQKEQEVKETVVRSVQQHKVFVITAKKE